MSRQILHFQLNSRDFFFLYFRHEMCSFSEYICQVKNAWMHICEKIKKFRCCGIKVVRITFHLKFNIDMIDNTALINTDATKSIIAFYSFARTTPYADVNKPWSYTIETSSVVGNPYPWDGDFLQLIQDQIRRVKSKSYTKVITPLLPGWGEELNNFNPAGVPPALKPSHTC